MIQPPDETLKALWKGQETETQPISLTAIRLRADAYRSRTRQRYLALCGLLATETLIFAGFAWTARNATIRAGDLMMIAAIAWMLWRVRDRWPNALPDSRASAATLIEFHRQELLRERFRLGYMLTTLGPILLSAAIMLAGMGSTEEGFRLAHWAPYIALTLAWIAALAWIVRRNRARLQRQIDEVDATRIE